MLLSLAPAKKSVISITPLIDVVFILLLFFMLSSTFNRTQQLEIKSVSASKSAAAPTDSTAKRLLVTVDGELVLDGKVLLPDSAELSDALSQIQTSEERLIVAAYADTPVQQLVAALDKITQQGITDFKLGESVTP